MKQNQFFESLSAGINVIKICTGVACKAKEERWVAENFNGKSYKLNPDQGTECIVIVETVPCLKACGLAPVVQINGRLYGKSNWREALEFLQEQTNGQQ